MRSKAIALACLLALATVLGACGERRERLEPGAPEQLDLMLDYFPNADHMPIYAAQERGRFRDVGLDVRIRPPADPSQPIKQVAAGRADLAVSYAPEVLRARDQGLNVVAVGALVQKPLTSIISLPEARIARPADLAGKRVGTAGIDYQSAYLKTIAEGAGIPPGGVREQNVGFNLVPALLAHRVDAVLGGFWNYEGVQLRLERRNPQVIRIEDAGVPPYDELVLVANEDALDRDKGRLRRFIGALAQGTRDLERDRTAGLKTLLDANPDLDRRLQKTSVDVTLPLFKPGRGLPYGYQDPREWRRFADWMRSKGLISDDDADEAFTNELLPGQGL